MTRTPLRLPWLESLAVLGIAFGAWLVHNTFQPASDTPHYALVAVGALDIVLCFGLLSYLLRCRLRESQALPRSWTGAAALLIACFVGWIAALFLDADRVRTEQQQLQEYLVQVAKLEDGLRNFADVLATTNSSVDKTAWQTCHDQFTRLYGQLQGALQTRPAWNKELARIDEHVQQMQKYYYVILAENAVEQRLKSRSEFQMARERAVVQAESLHSGIGSSERDLAAVYRARWHAVGASALTGVSLLVGCVLFWLVFDRELRRSWKAESRLADERDRFRALVEDHVEPIAVVDGLANILYANPAWQTSLNYQPNELRNRNLLDMIHPQDRAQAHTAMRSPDPHTATACRLSADYGVWRQVEIRWQALAEADTLVVRIRAAQETADVPMPPQPELLHDHHEEWQAAEARAADLANECATLRERESRARADLRQQRWLLSAHQQANADGVLLLSAHGDVLSWNPAFANLWKLSEDTLTDHTWNTIAAHMETQVETGWKEFQHAVKTPPANPWEMMLEAGRTVEVHVQALHDHPDGAGVLRFSFHDVSTHKDLKAQLQDHQHQARHWQKRIADHEETEKLYDSELRDQESRVKQLEKEIHEHKRDREDLDETLREHQDRLHQLHQTHENSAAVVKANKEAMRRLASGVANEVNQVLSVVIGNTDVLRENLPRDHVAQNYLDDIRQAATRGTELSQRLIAFSRNHLLQMAPVELRHQLTSIETKIGAALGHGVNVRWDLGDEDYWVKHDGHALEQAILNVVTQSRQHMPHGGTLTIAARRVQLSRSELTHADMSPGAYVQISLRDTGVGMDEDTLAHVFEPYHRVTDGAKGDLALATAQGILRQSGGCIDVNSEPGHGSEWILLLPETNERPQHGTLRASA